MIKPRRIGHATFETPDLEKAKAALKKSGPPPKAKPLF